MFLRHTQIAKSVLYWSSREEYSIKKIILDHIKAARTKNFNWQYKEWSQRN